MFRAPEAPAVGPGCFVCPWAAARPRVVRAASFARRVASKPGQAPPPPTGTAAWPCHRPRALQPGPVVPPPPSTPAAPVCWGVARPGPAAAHGHRSQALWSRHRPRHHGQAPTPQPGLAVLAGLVVSCVSMQPRGDVLVERDVGEWCGVPVRVCKKSAAPAGLRTCVELRRGRNSLSGGRPSPGAWCRRAR